MKIYFTLSLFLWTSIIFSQDTFSIVAVDLNTGEVGSAGATCLDDNDIITGALIISDVIPDHGAIHTQSYWVPANQQNAHDQFISGLSPEDLMIWLEGNDVSNQPEIRQYGAVDLVTGEPRAAAFTGSDCFDYKNHIVGTNYAIQGNILLGAEILEDMAAGFENTEGTLAEKLMAALQGANVPGADTRCLKEGVSSQSAFLRVACPGDQPDNLCLDLLVAITPFGMEPIDSLQNLFDNTFGNFIEASTAEDPFGIFPNPSSEVTYLQIPNRLHSQELNIKIYSVTGILERDILSKSQEEIMLQIKTPGLYTLSVTSKSGTPLYRTEFVIH